MLAAEPAAWYAAPPAAELVTEYTSGSFRDILTEDVEAPASPALADPVVPDPVVPDPVAAGPVAVDPVRLTRWRLTRWRRPVAAGRW